MPTYEYACENCGHRFEQFQSITAKSLKKCPECGKPKLARLIGSGAGIIFKGSGFYQTDYRSESYNKASKSEASAPASSDKSGKGAEKPKESLKEAKKNSTTKTDGTKGS